MFKTILSLVLLLSTFLINAKETDESIVGSCDKLLTNITGREGIKRDLSKVTKGSSGEKKYSEYIKKQNVLISEIEALKEKQFKEQEAKSLEFQKNLSTITIMEERQEAVRKEEEAKRKRMSQSQNNFLEQVEISNKIVELQKLKKKYEMDDIDAPVVEINSGRASKDQISYAYSSEGDRLRLYYSADGTLKSVAVKRKDGSVIDMLTIDQSANSCTVSNVRNCQNIKGLSVEGKDPNCSNFEPKDCNSPEVGSITASVCTLYKGFMELVPGSYGAACLVGDSCSGDLLCYKGKCKNDHTVEPGLMIDSHMHFDKSYVENAAGLVDEMFKHGIDKGILLPGCSKDHGGEEGDDAVWKVYEQYPNKFWPCLDAFDAADKGAASYVESQLLKRDWRCIGEVYLRMSPDNVVISPSNSSMMEVYKVAAKHKLPVFIHFEHRFDGHGKPKLSSSKGLKELEEAVKENPDTQFVWYHGCNGGEKENLALATKYSNLWCSSDPSNHIFDDNTLGVGSDIGCCGRTTLPDENLTPYGKYAADMREALKNHPDRFKIMYERMWDFMESFTK